MKGLILFTILALAGISALGGSASFLEVRGGAIQAGSTPVSVTGNEDGGSGTECVHVISWGLDRCTGLISFICIGGIESRDFGKKIIVCVKDGDLPLVSGLQQNIGSAELCITLEAPVPACRVTGVEILISDVSM